MSRWGNGRPRRWGGVGGIQGEPGPGRMGEEGTQRVPRALPQLRAASQPGVPGAPTACGAHFLDTSSPHTPLAGLLTTPTVQGRKLRPGEGRGPLSHRGRKGRGWGGAAGGGWGGQGSCMCYDCFRGQPGGFFVQGPCPPLPASSFCKHRPNQAQAGREGDERGGGCGLHINPSCAGSGGIQTQPGLLPPLAAPHPPCSQRDRPTLYHPVHTYLSPPLPLPPPWDSKLPGPEPTHFAPD